MISFELARNYKTGKGYIYNIVKDIFEKPVYVEGGRPAKKWVKGYYVLSDGIYLHRYDDSSWKNIWIYYTVFKVKNGLINTLATYKYLRNSFEFDDDKVKKHFLEFVSNPPVDLSTYGIDWTARLFAKYLISKGEIDDRL